MPKVKSPSQLQRLIRQVKVGDRKDPEPPGRPRTAEEVRAAYEERKAQRGGGRR